MNRGSIGRELVTYGLNSCSYFIKHFASPMKKSLSAFSYVSLVGAIVILGGCSQTSTPGNVSSGAIRGSVSLVDETGQMLPNFAGVTITLDSTSFSTTTDSTGGWYITGIPAGNYDVTISKPGFGFAYATAIPIAGPATADLGYLVLGEVPDQPPVIDTAYFLTKDSGGISNPLSLNVNFSHTPTMAFELCLDFTPNVAPESQLHASTYYDNNAPAADLSLGMNQLQAMDAVFASGTTIYISAAYVNPHSEWEAPSIGSLDLEWISFGSKSNVIAIKMP